MLLGRVLGSVVATQKNEKLEGTKLLLVQPLDVDGAARGGAVLAIDGVDAGAHERVLVVTGSSARMASGLKDTPVDAAIVGIIDSVDVEPAR